MTRGMNRALCASLVLAASVVAQPQTPHSQEYYIGAAAGIQNFSDVDAGRDDLNFDSGKVVGGLFGWRINENIRFEGEIAYQWADADLDGESADIWVFRTAIGGYYDLPISTLFVPYVGGGIGFSAIEFDNDELVNLSGSVAGTFHGEVGLGFQLSDKVALVPALRYEWNNVDFVGGDSGLTATSLRLGGRLAF